MRTAKIKSIVDELTAVPLAILLTHTHYDHIGLSMKFVIIMIFQYMLRKRTRMVN